MIGQGDAVVDLSALDGAALRALLAAARSDLAPLRVTHPDGALVPRDAAAAGANIELVADGPATWRWRPGAQTEDLAWLVEHWQRAAAGATAGRAPSVGPSSPGEDLRGLRLLLICHEATRTGAPMALLSIARWLAGRGVRLTTLVLLDGALTAEFAALGPVVRPSGATLTLSELGEFDLVYANTVAPSALVADLAGLGHATVVHSHELDHAIDGIGRATVGRALLASRHLLAVSEASEAALRRVLGAERRPITRISEPLTDDRFALAEELGRHQHGAERFVVGGFGTFCWLKGGDLLARCAALADARGAEGLEWSFRWVGQLGDDASNLLAALRAEGVADRLSLLGEHHQPLQLVRHFDVLALLSRQDSYPLAMLEAALVGVPTLAQRGSGGPEEFAVGGGAAIVDAESPGAVLEALASLARHPELRALMAAAGRRKVLADNTMAAIGPKVAAAIAASVPQRIAAVSGVAEAALVPADAPVDPTVSIVIPVFNRADMTERCLRQLARTVEPATTELVVVDNGSSDGSAELVARLWPSATVVRNRTNHGFARGCNEGVAAARADRIVLLNNDTEPTAGWLEALLAQLDDPTVGLVAPKLLFPDGTVQHAGMWLVEDRKLGLPLNGLHRYYRESPELAAVNRRCDLQLVTGAVLAMRRATFEQVGGFDEGYWNGCEDVELCLAVGAAGYRIVYEPASVLLHHESASGAERWTKLNENLRRLTERWAHRARPDIIVTAEGKVVPTGGQVPLPAPQGGLRVALEGTAFLYHSLAQVNRELVTRLAAQHGFDVIVRTDNVPELSPAEDGRLLPVVAASAAEPPLVPQVTIRHQWPPDWQAPTDDAPVVVIQPWEFGGLPDEWIEPLRDWPDEIWCYTSWVRDCYLRSGIPADRLVVLPIGVDHERFRPDGPALPLRTTKTTRLLFVGGLLHRKGVDLLLEAYGRAFSAADDVCLVVKSFGGDSVYKHSNGASLLEAARARPGAPEIEVISADLDQQEMAALYRSCHALVHPYRGEGFGMPIAEAMASGLAVVVTDDGAARDFCDEDTALLVASRRVSMSPASLDLPPSRTGYWHAEVDLDALVEAMRRIVSDVELRTSLAGRGRQRVCDQLDWTPIIAEAAARLTALAARPARRLGVATGAGDAAYHPGVVPHALDETRARTLLLVTGAGHPGWGDALASVRAALTGPAGGDVTVVIAVDDHDEAAQQHTLAALSEALEAGEAEGEELDVLAVLDHRDAVLAGLMVRCDGVVAVDQPLAGRARRCAATVVAADTASLQGWVGGAASAERAA